MAIIIDLFLVGASWLVLLGYWLKSTSGLDTNKESQITVSRIKSVSIALIVFILFTQRLYYISSHLHAVNTNSLLLYIAPLFCLIGLLVVLWSRFAIGNRSRSIVDDRNYKPNRSGPYKLIRHPLYSGFILMLLGTLLISVDIMTVIGFIISCLVIDKRIYNEELALKSHFPAAYKKYRKSTKLVIPYIL